MIAPRELEAAERQAQSLARDRCSRRSSPCAPQSTSSRSPARACSRRAAAAPAPSRCTRPSTASCSAGSRRARRWCRSGSRCSRSAISSDLEIVSDLLSSAAVQVEAGQAVSIEQWGGDRALRGRVRRVEPSGFTKISALGVEEQRVNVLIDFDEPREVWQRLGDGYRVEVRIIVWSAADVLKVPTSSLFRHESAVGRLRGRERRGTPSARRSRPAQRPRSRSPQGRDRRRADHRLSQRCHPATASRSRREPSFQLPAVIQGFKDYGLGIRD